MSRAALLERLSDEDHDVLIIGGGINGAVSALALAAHGVRVALIDQSDFAAGVSQESSNLIWGGFKYLQSYDVGLVARLCQSRNRIARAYPTRLRETRFLAALGESSPYSPWYAAAGAYSYWALGRFTTRPPKHHAARSLASSEPVIDMSQVRGAVEYSDYLLLDGDARFVVQMLVDAIGRGAVAVSRATLAGASRGAGGWRAEVVDELTRTRYEVSARVLVNAAGPHAAGVARLSGASLDNSLILSKGVHLVVPRVTESDRILAFFDDDQRLFYVIPMGHRSVIGATDTPAETAKVTATPDDFGFLLEQANARLSLSRPLMSDDVISHRCGVRPLVGQPGRSRSWMELSRRHIVEVDAQRGFVSVLGGKLSDCLNVGEEVVAASQRCSLQPSPPLGRWYGEPSSSERERFGAAAAKIGLARPAGELLWRRHGHRAYEVVSLIGDCPEAGRPLSEVVDYSAAEVMVMARHEHILTMEDFLRRRTLLAMREPCDWLAQDPGVAAAAKILFGSNSPDPLNASVPATGEAFGRGCAT